MHTKPRPATGELAFPVQPSPVIRGDIGAALEGQVRVTHDAPTNSLVVVASGRDFLALKDVIKKLDIPRQQVYLEAVILEVQLGNELRLGTSSHGGIPIDLPVRPAEPDDGHEATRTAQEACSANQFGKMRRDVDDKQDRPRVASGIGISRHADAASR